MIEKCVLNDFGLILKPEEQKLLCKALFSNEFSEESWRKDNGGAYVLRLAECLGLKVLERFAGTASVVSSDGKDTSQGSIGYFWDHVVYCPVSRYPSWFSQAYTSMDEIRDEFRAKFGKYLPKEFDYTLRHLEGAYVKDTGDTVRSIRNFWD